MKRAKRKGVTEKSLDMERGKGIRWKEKLASKICEKYDVYLETL